VAFFFFLGHEPPLVYHAEAVRFCAANEYLHSGASRERGGMFPSGFGRAAFSVLRILYGIRGDRHARWRLLSNAKPMNSFGLVAVRAGWRARVRPFLCLKYCPSLPIV
jgi:hypothetical protein